MDFRHSFHFLGERLTFLSPHETAISADRIELEPADFISHLKRDPHALGAAWRALEESSHGFQLRVPSEREIIAVLHERLLGYRARITVARATTAADGPRCGIGRVTNKHAPKETVELEGINRPGSPKKIVLEKHTAEVAKYHTVAEARKWVAPPGHSAHLTGCAIDFWFGFPCGKEFNPQIKGSKAYAWMVANANTHGFNSYGREGWHWEYNVGDPY